MCSSQFTFGIWQVLLLLNSGYTFFVSIRARRCTTSTMGDSEIRFHRHLVIGVTTFCQVLGVSAFGLRLWARRISDASLWWDDYLMGVGLVR